MIIYVLKDCSNYNIHCGVTIDTDDVDSPLTAEQAWAMCITQYATTDLHMMEARHIVYTPKVYECNANVVKDNALYQLKPDITSSSTWILSEWDLVLQGAV